MADIVILGAGVMGAALAVPASDAGNAVTLIGSPLDHDVIDGLARDAHHVRLDARLPERIAAVRGDAIDDAVIAGADVVVIGVSSPGVSWAIEQLTRANARPAVLALVTKGLVTAGEDSPPITYADALPASLCSTPGGLVGIGGPCIARELALGYPTRVTFAARHRPNAERLRELMQTATYRITTTEDVVGVEACAALKNFLCIGVSAMFTAHRLGDGHAKNPLAALYNQAVLELAVLAAWLRTSTPDDQSGAGFGARRDDEPEDESEDERDNGFHGRPDGMSSRRSSPGRRSGDRPGGPGATRGDTTVEPARDPAYDLAGMGDLHVTVGGGRNSRLGRHLGDGENLSAVLAGAMQGVTVEGVDTGRALSPGFHAACVRGDLDAARLPLTRAILACIDADAPFAFDFRDLP